jgi:branched-chain amino acid transport system ATP-binding protein
MTPCEKRIWEAEMGLKVEGLGVDYGGGEVVHGVDLEVASGEIVAMVGPNGAGKTTILKAIAGLVSCSRGSVRNEGQDLTRRSVDQRARSGVALVPENRGLIASMTVLDHLWLGKHGRPGKQDLDSTYEMFPQLARRPKVNAGRLSGGEAQMLAIATAVLTRPRILLIDELSFGLAPSVVTDLLARCVQLAHEQQMAVLIVEQFVDLALGASDRTLVLSRGVIQTAGLSAELRQRRHEIERAYLHFEGGAA